MSSVLPLVAAVIYAAGALLVKRAADLGVGVWRTAFVANVVGGVLYQPLWLLGGTLHADVWWQPVIAGGCFFVGQWFTFMAIDRGDVSVATPVLGLKIIFVAVLVTLLVGERLGWQVWTAAILATVALALLNRRATAGPHHHTGRTIFFATLAAAAFAVFDALVQMWSPPWGTGRFVPILMAVAAALSIGFIPAFRAPLSALPRPAWRWLLAGSATLALQSMLFVCTVAQWGEATRANVLYSSRGLWSVALVWSAGHWFRNREQQLERAVLTSRFFGAAMILSAIVLATA